VYLVREALLAHAVEFGINPGTIIDGAILEFELELASLAFHDSVLLAGGHDPLVTSVHPQGLVLPVGRRNEEGVARRVELPHELRARSVLHRVHPHLLELHDFLHVELLGRLWRRTGEDGHVGKEQQVGIL
jgi:hypothetical protein